MLRFLKSVLRNTIVLILAWVLSLVAVFFLVSVFMAGLKQQPIQVPEDAFLTINLSMTLVDKPLELSVGDLVEQAISGEGVPVVPLYQLLETIEVAARDPKITGILLEGSFLAGGGASSASLSEFRRALAEFSAAGKPVIAYLEQPAQSDYYLASAADQLFLSPMGTVSLTGYAIQVPLLKGMLEKIGVGIQAPRAGRFKDAVEVFTSDELSENSRLQLSVFLEDAWGQFVDAIVAERGLDREQLLALVNEDPLLTGSEAVDAGLVDDLLYYDEMLADLIRRGRADASGNTFTEITYGDYVKARGQRSGSASENAIAVLYGEGSIVSGDPGVGFLSSDRFAQRLRDLRQDDSVKGIVLRLDTPGGSVYASEVIRREVELTAAAKPLLVSMGGAAASGGYWISANADRIFAEESTVTGSIGVFGIRPNVEVLAEKVGVGFATVATTEMATMGSLIEPLSPEALALQQAMIDAYYQQFLEIVSEGRGMSVAEVDEIAQGRIWSGSRALDVGLVDEIGGLRDTIAYLVDELGLGIDYEVREVPRPKTSEEIIEELFVGDAAGQVEVQPGASSPFWQQVRQLERELGAFKDPHHIYARLPLMIDL